MGARVERVALTNWKATLRGDRTDKPAGCQISAFLLSIIFSSFTSSCKRERTPRLGFTRCRCRRGTEADLLEVRRAEQQREVHARNHDDVVDDGVSERVGRQEERVDVVDEVLELGSRDLQVNERRISRWLLRRSRSGNRRTLPSSSRGKDVWNLKDRKSTQSARYDFGFRRSKGRTVQRRQRPSLAQRERSLGARPDRWC